MALITLNPPVAAASGRIGSTIFHALPQALARAAPTTKASASPAQYLARSIFRQVNYAWRLIGSSNRLSWNTYAKAYPNTNTLGIPYRVCGKAMFMAINVRRKNSGLNYLLHPPPKRKHPLPYTFTLDCRQDLMRFEFQPDLFPWTSTFRVWGARPHTTAPLCHWLCWRLLCNRNAFMYRVPFTDEWHAILGRPDVGELIHLRLQAWNQEDIPSSQFHTTTVVRA